MGPSAPPARAAALRPASPARPPPAAQGVPLGSAYALAARRSRPSGLALSLVTRSAPSRPSGARAPKGRRSGALTSARPLPPRAAAAGGNLYRRAHWRRKRRRPRASRAAGRGGTPPAGGLCRPVCRPARPRQAPRWRLRRPCGGLACRYPGQRKPTVAGVPPCAGLPPLLILVNGGAFYVCYCLSCV